MPKLSKFNYHITDWKDNMRHNTPTSKNCKKPTNQSVRKFSSVNHIKKEPIDIKKVGAISSLEKDWINLDIMKNEFVGIIPNRTSNSGTPKLIRKNSVKLEKISIAHGKKNNVMANFSSFRSGDKIDDLDQAV